jgi:sulfide dehydrogenase cytochrome subunit
MNLSRVKWVFIASVFTGAVHFSSCQKADFKKDQMQPVNGEVPSVTATVVNIPGQELAANCFQCHGTNGFAGELKIASMGASEIINKFNTYKTMDPRADIMYVHAQAYTAEEIQLIANFFSKQQ